jgi:uncharacterized protein
VRALASAIGHNAQLRARRGLAIYFAVLVPLAAVFEGLIIMGNPSWLSGLVWVLMWTPAAASAVARLILREGFADVSFRIGGFRGWKAIVLALILPIVIGFISYGIAWATGLVSFSPRPLHFTGTFIGESASPVVLFLINLGVASTLINVFSFLTAAGEEIGWRGYMLTRLIDAGVPSPVLVSGLIWGLGHVPLILGGVYLTGSPPILSMLLFMVVATAFSFVFARLRLETGSVWPAITLHATWNSVIQFAFDPASSGPGATLWVGESGVLVALTMIVAAIIFMRGRWTMRRAPESGP